VLGLYAGQGRREAFARLAASAAKERRQSAEQLELALQGADLACGTGTCAATASSTTR
jgi:hypothetical protein